MHWKVAGTHMAQGFRVAAMRMRIEFPRHEIHGTSFFDRTHPISKANGAF